MNQRTFPVIDLAATGSNITRLRKERGLSVRDLQEYFGFEDPQAIYKWQWGKSLPSVDNLYALGMLLEVPMEDILVPTAMHNTIAASGDFASSEAAIVISASLIFLNHTSFQNTPIIAPAPSPGVTIS